MKIAALLITAVLAGRRRLTETMDNDHRCLADFASETRSACELYTALTTCETTLQQYNTCLGQASQGPMTELMGNDVMIEMRGRRKIIMIQDPANGFDEVRALLNNEEQTLDGGHEVHLEYSMMGGTVWISDNYDMQAFLRIPKSTRGDTVLMASVVNTEYPTSAPTYTMPPTRGPTYAPTTINCRSIFGENGDGHSFATLYRNRVTAWGGQSSYYTPLVINEPTEPLYSQMSNGHVNICAVRIAGENGGGQVDCWGSNGNVRQQKPGDSDFVNVSVGNGFACATKTNGDVRCWGDDDQGSVNNAPADGQTRSVHCGGRFACRIKTDNKLHCWGNNDQQQISQSQNQNEDFSEAMCGYHFCCALTLEDSQPRCWGYNAYNQVSHTPTDETLIDLKCGGYHCCGVKANNEMICWGYDNHGETSHKPDESVGWLAFGAGHHYSAGLTTDYRMRTWGLQNNNYGPSDGQGPMFEQDWTCGV